MFIPLIARLSVYANAIVYVYLQLWYFYCLIVLYVEY